MPPSFNPQFDPSLLAQFGTATSTTWTSSAPRFREGDRVVLLNQGKYTPRRSNPVWGGPEGRIAGTVIRFELDGWLRIGWDNGTTNTYHPSECTLELYEVVAREGTPERKRPAPSFEPAALDALVIAKEIKDEIVAVLKQQKHATRIFDEWGLGEVIPYGRGMSLLFYGGPGTGKTWAANCIAKAIGTELLVINAANIQTSEPGGANRNIENAFKSATEQGKVLFLDECDSLITSRNDVGMILGSEINTLLTEIEKFEGVVVLATNRVDTLDEALERRISLIVEFADPDYANREAIWKKLLPKKMPLAADVKLDKLAEHKLTGGQIKNCVLQAARLAVANDERKVSMRDFEAAIRRVQASKNLLGTASRYRQVSIREDFRKGH